MNFSTSTLDQAGVVSKHLHQNKLWIILTVIWLLKLAILIMINIIQPTWIWHPSNTSVLTSIIHMSAGSSPRGHQIQSIYYNFNYTQIFWNKLHTCFPWLPGAPLGPTGPYETGQISLLIKKIVRTSAEMQHAGIICWQKKFKKTKCQENYEKIWEFQYIIEIFAKKMGREIAVCRWNNYSVYISVTNNFWFCLWSQIRKEKTPPKQIQ